MRDFVSGFAAGFAGGVEKGAVLGLKARELRDDREAKAATLARQIAADKATADYRAGQLGIAGRNATETGRHNLATETTSRGTAAETGRHNKASEGTAAINAKANQDRTAAYVLKASGVDPALNADLASQGLGPTGGAVATPATPTAIDETDEATDAAKSITEEDQFISIFGPAGDTGEDPDKKEEGQ